MRLLLPQAQAGRVTFDIQASNDLIPNFELYGANPSVDGNQVSFDVTAWSAVQILDRNGRRNWSLSNLNINCFKALKQVTGAV